MSSRSSLKDLEDEQTRLRRSYSGFSGYDYSDDGDDQSVQGDYSTRMEELFDDDAEGGDQVEDTEDEEQQFVYTGVDAPDTSTDYHDQLRDVLGPELEEDETEAREVERSLTIDESNEHDIVEKVGILKDEALSPPASFVDSVMSHRVDTPQDSGILIRQFRPVPHPAVSRLRSYTPSASGTPSSASGVTSENGILSPSHTLAVSRTSSVSNLQSAFHGHLASYTAQENNANREVFRWTELRNITHNIYTVHSRKANSVLGAVDLGAPTVLAANGLVCVGTEKGRVCVYDFKQNLKCICGSDSSEKTVGPVTALALSHDHTFVATGHSTGHIQLFDLKTPHTPARSVPPTTLLAVASGRKEGHLQGSRIISIGFVAGRHTAIVSADEHGLAFYHSLGKVLFVEASDILRILGKYQLGESGLASPELSASFSSSPNRSAFRIPNTSLPHRRRPRFTIIDIQPLPLGTSPHVTDSYNIIALLTPAKLVVVGLKPTPRTWFKIHRKPDEGGPTRMRIKGALSWFPSVLRSATHRTEIVNDASRAIEGVPTTPTLVFTWGNIFHLVRVTESRTKQLSRNLRTGKVSEVEIGRIVYDEGGSWSAEEDILAIQWLNANQVIALTATSLDVYDAHALHRIEHVQFDGLSLISPTLSSTTNGSLSYIESVSDVSRSFRAYKGKIFLLGKEHLQVGTLLTWADRILSFVQDGDFISAIDLTRSYYLGIALGNQNGLPDDLDMRKAITGSKMRELMVASTRYTFSQDRMTDGTHVTPDNRGVDRTSLFEDLVSVSCRACIALQDFEFLFEDLFQHYDDAGIAKMYLRQLEPFILENRINNSPPRITQRLIALHEEEARPDRIERAIWHINPTCLDINQAIHLCQKYGLYDALIYVYTRALRDSVAPVVELLELIRKIQQYRRSHTESNDANGSDSPCDLEKMVLNAYKIYPYLSNILSGLSYPSETPLEEEEALRAKKDVYAFIFFGRSSVWPPGEGGKLVLTSDEEGGIEPTYPYVRQLLRFDSEFFLHSLDIAFEDSYLNDESQGISRLFIVRILLEIIGSGGLQSSDRTFVNIFIARNVPKYPQFLQLSPTTLHGVLVDLAEDINPDTREDRQLAAEYLLSVYNPHDSDHIIALFESAGFYRILRAWHRQEQRWAPLLLTYLHDADLLSPDLFHSISGVFSASIRGQNGALPSEVLAVMRDALPRLLRAGIASTATLVDKHAPELHGEALKDLTEVGKVGQFDYLRRLLGPPDDACSDGALHKDGAHPSANLPPELCELYISLQCELHAGDVIKSLDYIPTNMLNWDRIRQICETNEVFYAIVWALDRQGDPHSALERAEQLQYQLTMAILEGLDTAAATESSLSHYIDSLQSISDVGISICLRHSEGASNAVNLEDMWFQLLSSQIHCVQLLHSHPPATRHGISEIDAYGRCLAMLRSLVQKTFTSLVSVSSTQRVSFPRLFKRLVTSASMSTHTQYTEFRTILTGMLESYRSEGDMLFITKHLLDRDLFNIVAELTHQRSRGWTPSHSVCHHCRQSFTGIHRQPDAGEQIIISRTGFAYHRRCSLS